MTTVPGNAAELRPSGIAGVPGLTLIAPPPFPPTSEMPTASIDVVTIEAGFACGPLQMVFVAVRRSTDAVTGAVS
jgi:hypothetical protein